LPQKGSRRESSSQRVGASERVVVGSDDEKDLRADETLTVPVLRDVLPEGLPVPSVVLILADPGAGREMLTLELLSTRLRAGHKVLWISLENFPNALRATFELTDVDKTIHERVDSLEFFDCYSSQVGTKSTERYSADPSNLPNLSVAISLAISKLSRDAHLVVMLDSLSSLVQMAGARAAIEFFRTLVGKVRSVEGDLLTTLNGKAFSPTVLASVQEMVDGVLELRMTDDQTDVHRYLRIRKMLGRRYDSMSIPYDIDEEHGVLRRAGGPPVSSAAELTIDASGRERAQARLSSVTESISVEDALLQAIDSGLLALGEIARDTFYDRFDQKYQLKREEIPERLGTFHYAFETMVGAGARLVETQMAKSLMSKLGLDFTENTDWNIVDYFEHAKAQFRTKTRVESTQPLFAPDEASYLPFILGNKPPATLQECKTQLLELDRNVSLSTSDAVRIDVLRIWLLSVQGADRESHEVLETAKKLLFRYLETEFLEFQARAQARNPEKVSGEESERALLCWYLKNHIRLDDSATMHEIATDYERRRAANYQLAQRVLGLTPE